MNISSAYACCGSKDGVPRRSRASWESGLPRQAGWSARRPSWRRLRSRSKRWSASWISPGWSTGLDLGDRPDWPRHDDPAGGSEGLITVLVARRPRFGKVSACGYLVDAYCLGVKNALGPELMDERDLRGFVRRYFSTYHGDPVEAPIDLAREIVFGSVRYARGLGFEPHPDFAAAAGHLGTWTGPGTISFGKDGKPLYVFGPYDDHRSVIRTLKRTVGRGNFEVLAITG